jgi:fibronectin type 3 domain-containing protein
MILLVVALLPGALGAQQEEGGLLVAPAVEGTALRWVWPEEGRRPLGYHVERREEGGTWTRLTPQALVRVREREVARRVVGDAFDRYEGLLFPSGPSDAVADPASERSLLLLSADLEPGVARVLGLRFDDTGAERGRAYEYRLIAVTDDGERAIAHGGPVVAGSYREADPPDSLEADQPPEGVALRWSPAGAFSAYHVYRRGSQSDWTRINAAPVVVFSADAPTPTQAPWFFRDTSAVVGDTLGYTVVGLDPFGRESRRSAEARLVVRDVAPPARPPQVWARVQGDTVWVSWVASPDPSVVTYRVWRAAERDGPFEPIAEPVPTAVTSVADVGRPPGRMWWYRVTAADRAGNESDPSFLATVEVRDLIPPPAPAGLSALADTGRITLVWTPAAAPDLRGYRIYRASGDSALFGLLTAAPVGLPEFVDGIRLGADRAFHYRVTAVDSAFNESAPSLALAVSPLDTRPPSAPRIEWVRPCEDCLVVRWMRNPERDVMSYQVRYRPRGDSVWRDLPVVAAAPGATDTIPSRSATDTIPALEPRRLYEVTVLAVDDAGNASLPARLVAGEPIHRQPPPPLAVRRVSYDAAAGGVVVEWSSPSGGVERVRLVRRDRETGALEAVGDAAPGDGRAVDRRVQAGRTYEYALRPVDRFGNSAEPAGWRRVSIPEPQR